MLGSTGVITLEFFNDRLYEVTFHPTDLSGTSNKLFRTTPGLKRDRNGRANMVKGNLRVATNIDLANSDVGRAVRTTAYILWQDKRLRSQLDDWDVRFGNIPVRVLR